MLAVDEPGRVPSGILAVVVHLLFFGMLVFGISWQKKIAGPVVVDLWEDLPEPVRKVSAPPPKVDTPPKPVPEVRKEPPPPPPKVEAPPKPSPADIELREKLRKQKEEDEARRLEEKKAAEAEKRRLAEERRAEEEQRKIEKEQRRAEEEAKRLEQEKLKREEEARRLEEQKQLEERKREEEVKRVEQEKLKREAEARDRAAAVERERQQQEIQRKQREADEARRRVEAAERAAQQKVIDDWKVRIQEKIRGRVVVPANIQGNPEARFEVVLLPGGEVLNITLKKSSGVEAYDTAVGRAIMAAQPLPVPDGDLFQENFRELHLKFRPKD
ncbi:MAG TPA: cell envelope integrity protein TolA [Burkholderiales bacterium]|jgi:colicin import membrane protein|nr:cell envelope integrity protein TolA [Burkholderiales bacterium]